MMPRTDAARARHRTAAPADRLAAQGDLRQPEAVAARAAGPAPEPALHARLRGAAVHRVRRDPRRPPLRRRPRHRRRHGPLPRRAGARRRAPEGRRGHQAEDLPELRLREARGLPQGDPGDEDGREVRPADHRHRRHAGGLSGHRVGGARRRRGDCLQPPGDGRPRRADHRGDLRRRRQRRRARPGDRRSDPDPGVRDLQRHPAGRVRRDSLARLRAQGRGRGGAQADGARHASVRDRRRDRARAGRRRRTTTRRRRPGCSTARFSAPWTAVKATRPRGAHRRALRRSSGRWAGAGSDFVDTGARRTQADAWPRCLDSGND